MSLADERKTLAEVKQSLADPRSLAQFKMALPEHIKPEKFQRAAITALLNSPDIGGCTKESVLNALMKCAQDGLIPDNKEAALVKYGSVCTYMPMVYGLIKRMRNSGEVKDVNAFVVYAKDRFEYQIKNGVQETLHIPTFDQDRGDMLLAYSVVTLSDGTSHVEVMTKADIERARNAGKAAQGPAWKNWYEEMAKKTVIHRAAKRVPTSADVEKLLNNDMRVTIDGDASEEVKPISLIDSINEATAVEIGMVEQSPAEETDFPGDK